MNEQIKVEVEVETKQETIEERPARLTVEVPTELQAGVGPAVCTCPPGCCC